MLVGLAAVFNALLPQQEAPWAPPATRRARPFLAGEITPLRRGHERRSPGIGHAVLRRRQRTVSDAAPAWAGPPCKAPKDAIHHLRRAAESGRFSRDLARAFLLQLYVAEKRYRDAIPLGQSLHRAYPGNGYFSLLTGRSQFEHGDKAQAAATLGALAATLAERSETLVGTDARFDLYYTWAGALLDTDQHELAFEAFRGAINNDPRTTRTKACGRKFLPGNPVRAARVGRNRSPALLHLAA